MKKILFITFVAVCALSCRQQVAPPQALYPVPSERQLVWHEMEQYAFIHFTTNTFTGKEWGYGDEQPSVFNPTAFDAEQWAKAVSDAGLKAIILTCKHHDGFCLFPSAYTEHSIKHSPFMDGKGDIVKAVADACRKHGLKFGVYLSPWDRNRADYGTPNYVAYYRNQLRELLTNYGEIFEVWFDGANGGDGYYGGANEIRKIDNTTYYDWANTHALVRELSPNTIIWSDAGPDTRFSGNEHGIAGETNWCTITTDTLHPGKFDLSVGELLNRGSEDGTSWVPIEADVSIRPGWFYHAEEDSLVKTPENLFQIYLQSVGRGATLLINIPPDRRGLLHENDVRTLMEWKRLRDEAFAINLAASAKVTADNYRGNAKQYAPARVIDGNKESYWATDDNVTAASLEIHLNEIKTINYIVLQEYIALGQRVKAFEIETWDGNKWQPATKGTTIGYKRILPISPTETDKVRLTITDSKACLVISNVALY